KTIALGLEKRVRWMGYRASVGHELAGLDLLLSFSKAEGLPISLLESGWAATPVLATRVGGVMDLFPDESFGTTIPPKEAPADTAHRLRQHLNPEGQDLLVRQARHFQQRVASEFTQTRWIEQLNDLYAELGVSFGSSSQKTVFVPQMLSKS